MAVPSHLEPSFEPDPGALEPLDEAVCRVLLKSVPIGRIVFTHQALPRIQPVSYALDGDDVVIRVPAASKVAQAVQDAVVAFEIDDFDEPSRTGWSVVVVGHARREDSPAAIAALRRLGLRSWGDGPGDAFIRIVPEILSGRRVRDLRP
ncbi:pyridoxamine 5'-phosphate oxidase family protein [Actinocorallia sp. A-T 12471]|uniref:pyridoxamine 5'-phosphate oxidase family protein n=1 Tax=Actinocorallia sp. A-T 12471 TaxID=3089813 RepID=UPI0029D0C791|nr:pyridoxamine 5'-phosphate oxidase family protein [Actinocorallia sp. A-T 12471]MDX6744331.1 pyridoxamine 5'-phosphate oxidase family protein [Actinocorallia sp. A-T 12471]